MLTLEETSENLPIHISNMLEKIDIKLKSKTDIMMILIYSLAIECGFYPYEQVKDSSEDLEWKNNLTFSKILVEKFSNYIETITNLDNQNYEIIFGFSNFDMKILLFGVTVFGDQLMITFSIEAKYKKQGKSILISVPRYIPLPLTAIRKKKFSACFYNMKELSFKMKEFVLVPIRNALLYYRDDCIYPDLLGIPTEVRQQLFPYLNTLDSVRFSSCCWQLRADYLDYAKVKKPEIYRQFFNFGQ